MDTITIDGPCASGKGTLATMLAKHYRIKNFDSGAMYRAYAVAFVRSGLSLDDKEKLEEFLKKANITIEYNDKNEQIMLLDGENINSELRTEQISMLSSKMATIDSVKKAIAYKQRLCAMSDAYVMDGRDIGSFVYPEAKHKFYITASQEVRAKRRFNQLKEKNKNINFDDVLRDLKKRDEQDMNRKLAPLIVPKGAIVIDNSNQSEEETFNEIIKNIKE